MRAWREDLHPRGRAGRFAHVAAHGKVRVAGPDTRVLAHPGPGAPGLPKGWAPVPVGPGSGLAAEELARYERRYGITIDPDTREFLTGILDRDVHTAVSNGTATIYLRGKKARPEHVARIAAQVEQLQRAHPAEPPVRVFVDPGKAFEHRSIAGETMRGQATIRLNENHFGRSLRKQRREERFGHVMPAFEPAKALEYVLSHEWGHATDPHHWTKPSGEAALDRWWARVHPTLSRYGRTQPAEGYAEAFAEWHLSKGTTQNLAARTLAEMQGWATPRRGVLYDRGGPGGGGS